MRTATWWSWPHRPGEAARAGRGSAACARVDLVEEGVRVVELEVLAEIAGGLVARGPVEGHLEGEDAGAFGRCADGPAFRSRGRLACDIGLARGDLLRLGDRRIDLRVVSGRIGLLGGRLLSRSELGRLRPTSAQRRQILLQPVHRGPNSPAQLVEAALQLVGPLREARRRLARR